MLGKAFLGVQCHWAGLNCHVDHTECLKSDFIPWDSLGAAEEIILMPAVAFAVPVEGQLCHGSQLCTFSVLHMNH